jgi:hypothetical protein
MSEVSYKSPYRSGKSPWVLIEGPGPVEAAFLGRWLLAADEADQKLQQQFKINPRSDQEIDRLQGLHLIFFSSIATTYIHLLLKNRVCFSLDLWDEEAWGYNFPLMVDLGFFRKNGNRYQMTIPNEISGSRIEATLSRLAATEDHECILHPEHLVTSLSKANAQNLMRLLEKASLVRAVGYWDNKLVQKLAELS